MFQDNVALFLEIKSISSHKRYRLRSQNYPDRTFASTQTQVCVHYHIPQAGFMKKSVISLNTFFNWGLKNSSARVSGSDYTQWSGGFCSKEAWVLIAIEKQYFTCSSSLTVCHRNRRLHPLLIQSQVNFQHCIGRNSQQGCLWKPKFRDKLSWKALEICGFVVKFWYFSLRHLKHYEGTATNISKSVIKWNMDTNILTNTHNAFDF